MASLKEIKVRTASIRSTQKITAAMKMVSSAKLHRAETQMEQTARYSEQLTTLFNRLLRMEGDWESPYLEKRAVHRVTLVVCSSDSGLCGSFNAAVWKELALLLKQYEATHCSFRIYPIGKKIAEELHKAGYPTTDDYITLGEQLSFEAASRLADQLIQHFTSGDTDRVELLYHHFKNRGTQLLTRTVYLPIEVPEAEPDKQDTTTEILVEPSLEELRALLIPQWLHLQIYTILLDSITAEHAARMMAMQTANDNANDLIQELTRQYNKSRQQAITNELLDIIGGQ